VIMRVIRTRASVSELRRAIGLFWLLCDQAIFTLTNFGLNVLFARWLTPAEYGLYGVSFSGFMLVSIVHYTSVLEPLLVQAAGLGGFRCSAFVRTAIIAHSVLNLLAALVSVALFLIAEAFGAREIGLAMLCVGVGGPAMLALLTMRRLCLVFMSAQTPAVVGIIYCAGVAGTAYAFHVNGSATWIALWLVTSVWSLGGAAIIGTKLVRNTRARSCCDSKRKEMFSMGDLCRFQWRYAKYGIVGSLFAWLRGSGTMMVASHFVSLASLGGVVAMQSLGQGLVQVNSALAASWLVRFSRGSANGRGAIALGYIIAVGGVVLLAAFFASVLVHEVYHGKYDQYAWQFPLFLLTFGVIGLEDFFSSQFKAAGKLARGYAPHLGAAFAAIAGSLSLVPAYGASAVVFSVLLASAVGLAVAAWPDRPVAKIRFMADQER
jgi:O-antigen/teichoic acid export membrane protein